jgi:putative colanic acid biosynthesis acetyltransferase WcaF
MQTDLSKYNNSWYHPGANKLMQLMWYFVNVFFFINPWNPLSGIKVRLLRLFGAKIGRGVVIKPSVNIKYPWRLAIGHNTWIGEKVWIDNLEQVSIGNNCCLSQDALLLCGNHNYKKVTFDLMIAPIILEDGVWIGARSLVTGGVTCHSHSVLAAGSLTNHNLDAYTIYAGSPAVKIRDRTIE